MKTTTTNGNELKCCDSRGIICPAPLAPLLLTETQAAEVLSLSPRKVWELAAQGAIPFIKVGAVKRYRLSDLEAWVAKGCPAGNDSAV